MSETRQKIITVENKVDIVRMHLLDKAILVFAYAAIFALLVSFYRSLNEQFRLPFYVQCFNFVIIWSLVFFKDKIKPIVKAVTFLTILTNLEVSLYLSYGISSTGSMLTIAISIVLSLLYGRNFALYVLFAKVFLIFLIPFSVYMGWYSFGVDFEKYNTAFPSWLSSIVSFLVLSIVVVILTSGLYNAVIEALKLTLLRAECLKTASNDLKIEVEERKRTETVLRATEEKFVKGFESSPSIIFIVSLANLKVIDVNKSFELLTGYSHAEIVDHTFKEIDLWDEGFVYEDSFQSLVNAGFVKNVEAFFRTKLGQQHIGLLSSELVEIDGMPCALSTLEDITNQRRREKELKMRNVLLSTQHEVSQDAIVAVDPDFIPITYNKKLLTMFEIPVDRIEGKLNVEFLELLSQKFLDTQSFKDKVAYLNTSLKEVSQEELVLKDSRVFEVYSSPMFIGTTDYYGRVWYFKDITERRRNEEDLKKYSGHLEELVHQRTYDLVEAKDRAEAADKMKSSFMGTMSHELRTPLNSIIGFSAILLKEQAGVINEEQRNQLSAISSSSRHLLNLVNDVLDVIKLEAGTVSGVFDSFDLRASINKTVEAISVLIKDKELAIQVDISDDIGWVYSDRRRVEQVMINLLNNAIKFTPKGSVSLICRSFTDAKVLIRVEDTGIGIKEEDLAKLFKPFVQVDSEITRQYEGTGLGLYISKRVIDLLGGEIKLTSEFGKGTIVEVVLPIKDLGDDSE